MSRQFKTQLLCSGYTGKGFLYFSNEDYKKLSLLSYDVALNRKMIYSTAVYPKLNTHDVSDLKRIGNPVLFDTPQLTLTISFQTTKYILNKLKKNN